MSDWKKRESLLSKFLTRKHTYHQDILSFCSFVYNNYLLDSILPFLAMAKSKQASLCSSGLTKTFFCLFTKGIHRYFVELQLGMMN